MISCLDNSLFLKPLIPKQNPLTLAHSNSVYHAIDIKKPQHTDSTLDKSSRNEKLLEKVSRI